MVPVFGTTCTQAINRTISIKKTFKGIVNKIIEIYIPLCVVQFWTVSGCYVWFPFHIQWRFLAALQWSKLSEALMHLAHLRGVWVPALHPVFLSWSTPLHGMWFFSLPDVTKQKRDRSSCIDEDVIGGCHIRWCLWLHKHCLVLELNQVVSFTSGLFQYFFSSKS